MGKKMHKLLLLALALVPMSSLAINKPTTLFMYGFAASFNDSTVYFTGIQKVDTAWTDSKTGFLYSRENYSYQLRDYMKKHGSAYPTCITVYAKKRKDIEKKYETLKKRYASKGQYTVKFIPDNEFLFRPIIPDESERKE